MIVIVDYGMGNLGSIQNMIKKVGAQALISSKTEDIEKAAKLILPGVGAFDEGMRQLTERGLISALTRKALEQKTPVLGICLGMQLLTRRSEEGKLPGLGWIDADTKRFKFENANGLKIPHMGWNTVTAKKEEPLFAGYTEETRFYFVHSYHTVCDRAENAAATTHYGYDFACAVRKGNIAGVQFHPEKSHKFGMRLFRNFLAVN
jgi:glutamine amidotransferase